MATNGDGILDPSGVKCLLLLGVGKLFIFVGRFSWGGRFFIDARMGKRLVLCNVGERKRSATSPYVSS